MITMKQIAKMTASFLLVITILCMTGVLVTFVAGSQAPAQASAIGPSSPYFLLTNGRLAGPHSIHTACAGGPTIDGIVLDECFVETFTVGATTKSVTVWFTNNMTSVTRDVDGTLYTLVHGINNDSDAQDVA